MTKTSAMMMAGVLLVSTTALAAPKGKTRKPAAPTPAAAAAPQTAPAETATTTRGSGPLQHGALYVEFGETTLGGQSHKGAITVVERPELAQHSLLKQRSHFRAELGDAVR